MALAISTPIRDISLVWSSSSQTWLHVGWTSDEMTPQEGVISYPLFPASTQFSGNEDDFYTLQDIYDSAAGFVNAAGDPSTVYMDGVIGVSTLAELADSRYGNPFLPEPLMQGSDPGITQVGPNSHNILRWRRSATTPAEPPTDWWNADAGAPRATPDWHPSRPAAIAAVAGSDPIWLAHNSVSVSGDGVSLYNGWSITAEFGVEYSGDSGATWHDAQMAGDDRIAFRDPDGNRIVLPLGGATPDLDWTTIVEDIEPYNQGAIGASFATGGVNLDRFERLRFIFKPFGDIIITNHRVNFGGLVHDIVTKPDAGWQMTLNDDNTAQLGEASWKFDDLFGATVSFHREGSLGQYTVPSGIYRAGADSNGNGYAPQRLAGKLKFITWSAAPNLDVIRFYDWSANSANQRFRLTIEGASY